MPECPPEIPVQVFELKPCLALSSGNCAYSRANRSGFPYRRLFFSDFQQSLETQDEAAEVQKVIDQLRPEQRDVLMRTLVGGQTQQEVADSTGMPLGTVKSHARRGLHQVRSMMGLDPVAPSQNNGSGGDS